MVGATGRVLVSTESGAAILSGLEPPDEPGEDYEPGTGHLDVSVAGSVTGDIRVLDDGDLTAMISGMVNGGVEALGGGDLTAAISGAVDGDVKTLGDGDLTATISGTVDGDVKALGDGDLMATISGMVGGGVEALGSGEHTVTVATGGAVSGTIHLAGSAVTVHGSAGCVVLDNGGAVNVGASGRISCPDGGVRSGGGDLTVDVAGKIMGDVHARGNGEHTVTVAERGAVSGTVRLASRGVVTAGGAIGSAVLDKGGTLTVGASGSVDGVQSSDGDLTVDVAGNIKGDVNARGNGKHTVTVAEGGAVSGTARLASPGVVTVGGAIGSAILDKGGTVTVRASGSIEGVDGVGVQSNDGDLTVDVAGKIMGDVNARGNGKHTVTVAEGGAVSGTVRIASPDVITVGGAIGSAAFDKGGTLTLRASGSIEGVDGVGVQSNDGDLTVDVAGKIMGDVNARGNGKHTVTVAEGGAVSGTVRIASPDVITVGGAIGSAAFDKGGTLTLRASGSIEGVDGVGVQSSDGDLTVDVAGKIMGDVNARGNGKHTVTVAERAAVSGTVHIASPGVVTVGGAIGSAVLDKGGALAVRASGSIEGVNGVGVQSSDGDLTVDVAGKIMGDVNARGNGEHTVTVAERAAVSGTVRIASPGVVTVGGAIGSAVLDKGGTLTVHASGSIDGVDDVGVQSNDGDLTVNVAGKIMGDVNARGNGEHTVTVAESGSVSGTIHLAGSTVTVRGSVGCVVLDNGGAVNVGASGRISCPDGGVRSDDGDLTATISGMVDGGVEALGGGEHMVTVAEGAAVSGTVHLASPGVVAVGGVIGSAVLDKGGMVTVGENGRVEGVGDVALSGGTGELEVVVEQAAGESASEASKRVNGRIIERDGQAAQVYFKTAGATGTALPVGKVGTREAIPEGAFDVGVMADGSLGADYAPRTRIYEALPSVLLGLAALPTHRDRMAAVRTPNGAWARIEAGGGERKAKRSESTDRIGYDHRHWGVQTGVDVLLGEDALVGVAAHHRRGTAELSGNDGEIETAGTGLGVSGA